MLKDQGAELALAAIPSLGIVQELRTELGSVACTKEIYLAYSGEGCGRFSGFLITEAGNIDMLIALCPITADLVVGGALWRCEVRRQWRIAKSFLSTSAGVQERADVIWFRDTGPYRREMPIWIFSLSCVPLTSEWDGELLHPKPFCPTLFESMARQPAAARWLRESVVLKNNGDGHGLS